MKKFLTIALGLLLTASTVSAEQPKAQEYRDILTSGTFYIEYEDENVKRIIAEENGRRIERADLSGNLRKVVSILNPIAALFSKGNNYPDFMYDNGNYYRFIEKDYAIMANESHFNNENINPAEGWHMVNKELSLPDEIAVFNWNDKFHKVSNAVAEPVFANTIDKVVDGKKYICDRYESNVTTANGDREATIVFDLCYDKGGNLILVQSAIFANGREYGINKLTIKKFQREIPKGAINIDNKAKIYAAGIGDMNDLLEIPVLIGKLRDIQ